MKWLKLARWPDYLRELPFWLGLLLTVSSIAFLLTILHGRYSPLLPVQQPELRLDGECDPGAIVSTTFHFSSVEHIRVELDLAGGACRSLTLTADNTRDEISNYAWIESYPAITDSIVGTDDLEPSLRAARFDLAPYRSVERIHIEVKIDVHSAIAARDGGNTIVRHASYAEHVARATLLVDATNTTIVPHVFVSFDHEFDVKPRSANAREEVPLAGHIGTIYRIEPASSMLRVVDDAVGAVRTYPFRQEDVVNWPFQFYFESRNKLRERDLLLILLSTLLGIGVSTMLESMLVWRRITRAPQT